MANWYIGPGGTDAAGRGTNAGDPFATWVYAMAASATADTLIGADAFDSNEVGFVNVNTKAKILQGAGAGTIIQSDGTLRVLYLGTSNPIQLSNFTLYERDNSATGSNRLLERNSPAGTCTVSNVVFDNGRFQSIWNRPDAAGMTLNDCTYYGSISSHYAFLSLSDGGVNGCTVNRLTATTTSTPAASYIMHQIAAWNATATIGVHDSNITFGGPGQLFRLRFEGGATPVATGNTITTSLAQNIDLIECNHCVNEVITGNTIFSRTTASGYNTMAFSQTGATKSVATVSNNIIYQYNNANHVIMFGDEILASTFDAYEGSICSGNKVYCGGVLGLGTGTVHGLMGAYNSVYFKDNEVHGADLAIVLKHMTGDYSTTYCAGNKLYNNDSAFRIKGAPNTRIYGNLIECKGRTNEYALSITENFGGDASTGGKYYNNIVNIDSGLVYFGDAVSLADIDSDYNFYSMSGTATFSNFSMGTLALWRAGRNTDWHSGLYNPATKYKEEYLDAYDYVMSETFQNALKTRDNGTMLKNGALIKENGLELNGTDQYALRPISFLRVGAFATTNELNIEMEFTPNFAHDANATRYLFSAGTDYYLAKLNNAGNNVLRLYLGGTSIVDIASATYSPYWNVNTKNKIVIATKGTATASTDVYLNGTLIVNALNTAWTRTTQTMLNIGSDSSNANVFSGYIHSIRIGKRKFNATEISRIALGEIFNLPWKAEYPLTTATHDVANTRSLDVSNRGNHLLWTAGATAPTKLTEAGYSTDGNDFMRTAGDPLSTPTTGFTMVCVCELPNNSTATQSIFDYSDSVNTGNRGGTIMYSTKGLIRFYVRAAAGGNAATRAINQAGEGGIYVIVGLWDGTNVQIWVNGTKGGNATGPQPPIINANTKVSILARANGTTSPVSNGGKVFYAAIGDFVITETQVRYLTNKLRNWMTKT